MSRGLDRRALLTLLAVGTASACTQVPNTRADGPPVGAVPAPAPAPGVVPAAHVAPTTAPVATTVPPTESPTAALPPTESAIPAVTVGPPVVLDHLPSEDKAAKVIAITIDDGFDKETVSAYVEFAQRTGIHLTFNPNGCYSHVWNKHAKALKPLLATGQVQIGNHTFNHKDVKKLSEHGLEQELQTNEDWVQQTFGTTTRPWFRPPFGFRDERTDEIAASYGWTNILMWNGSFGDSGLLTPDVLMQQARLYLRPGVIMLGHANHPTVTHLYDQIVELMQARELTPKTLNEAFSGLPLPGAPGSPGPRASA